MTDSDTLTLKDLPTDAIERIGSFMNPLQRRSLGQAITNQTGRHYLLGQKQQIHDFAAQKIQSFMNAPVIQNTLTRVPAVIRPHVYSVKPSDRSRAQMRDMKRRVNEFNDPGGRGIAQLRTRHGSIIDRGR
eukprot:SAG22_NODE_857_length_6837_cov_22.929059_7_plen_131_part_00